ncbi:MAG: hypothetical protein GF364_16245 [Candidatus Lokiarchaeota archaeon]|nr:hypothetical protein [Candidatus Lokiarchaeota archaeon]
MKFSNLRRKKKLETIFCICVFTFLLTSIVGYIFNIVLEEPVDCEPNNDAEIMDLPLSSANGDFENVNTIGNWSYGASQIIEVRGDIAYLSSGLRVIILNISDPEHPVEVADIYITDRDVEDIDVEGNTAYFVSDANGVFIYNVTDVNNPKRLGHYLNGTTFGVDAVGNYLYVADGSNKQLEVVDVSDPTNPTLLGYEQFDYYAYDVFVLSNTAYVASGPKGLRTVNITDPANPDYMSNYETDMNTWEVVVIDDLAYTANGIMDGLKIINVSDPYAMTLKGSYTSISWGEVYDVDVSGDYAYITNQSDGIDILNISDPANPELMSSYDTYNEALTSYYQSDVLYVADEGGGLVIVNVTDKLNPELYSQLILPEYYKIKQFEELGFVRKRKKGRSYLYGSSDKLRKIYALLRDVKEAS